MSEVRPGEVGGYTLTVYSGLLPAVDGLPVAGACLGTCTAVPLVAILSTETLCREGDDWEPYKCPNGVCLPKTAIVIVMVATTR